MTSELIISIWAEYAKGAQINAIAKRRKLLPAQVHWAIDEFKRAGRTRQNEQPSRH